MKILKRIIMSFCLILVIVILPWLINPVINNIRLAHFSRQIYTYSLPMQTKILEKQSICGKLNGNGDGMDFLATILIKSDFSLEELQSYYSFATVIKQVGMILNSEYLQHGEIRYSNLKNVTNFNDYYVVFIFDGGHPALFDIRGG